MATQVTIEDPTKARAYFEAKMAFTTGPVELERMMKSNAVTVVDVRGLNNLWPRRFRPNPLSAYTAVRS